MAGSVDFFPIPFTKSLHVPKPHADRKAAGTLVGGLQGAIPVAKSDIDRCNNEMVPLGIFDNRRRHIESHRLGIKQRTGKFGRIIALEPSGRVTDEREASCMTFGKAVLTETFDLLKDSLGKLRGYSLFLHPGYQAFAMAFHPSGAMPCRHISPKLVGFAGCVIRRYYRELHHLFLEKWHS